MKKDTATAFAWISVALIVGLVCQPLWSSQPPDGHDLPLHFYRIAVVNALWEHGVLFSRWLPDLVMGYGSPLFLFYPPGSAYLLTAVYHLIPHGPIAYNLTFALLLATAVIGMFLLGRTWYNKGAGVIMAAAYAFSPYLLYTVFTRSSLSNLMALALFPWAVWGMWHVVWQPSGRWVGGTAVLLALIFFSHTAAALLFCSIIGIVALVQIVQVKSNTVQASVGCVLLTFGLGLGLSATAWLPALIEFRFSQYDAAAHTVDFRNAFATHWLEWPFPAVAGLYAPLPITPGLGQLFIGGVAWLLALRGRQHRPLMPVCLGLLAGSFLLLTQPLSTPLWEQISLLQNFQFPWRLLDVPAFCLPVLCGWFVWRSNGRFQPLFMAICLLVFYLNALPYLYPPYRTDLPLQPSLADVTQVQQQYGIYGLTSWGEYSTHTMTTWPALPAFVGADQEATLDRKLVNREGVLVASGTPWQANLQFDLPTTTNLTFYSHYFPGWQAEVDGQQVIVMADENGRLTLPIPSGQHHVRVYWGRTPVRWLADGLSLVAVLGVAGVWLVKRSQIFSPPAYLPTTTGFPLAIPLLLFALLIGKVTLLDRFNTPLVQHPAVDYIPGVALPVWGDFGPLRLIGQELTPDGSLKLYWQAQENITTAYQVVVHLLDARGVPVKTITNPYPGSTPMTYWKIGRLTVDTYQLPIHQEQRPIGYRVMVSLVNSQTGQLVPLLDAPAETAEIPIGTLKRPPQPNAGLPAGQPIGAVLGEAIELIQITMPEQVIQGEWVDLTMVWRCKTAVPADYTVFIHLVAADGTLVATSDGQPLGGLYPTSYWAPGEQIMDTHPWQLEAPPGHYRLEVGLYQLTTGERLSVTHPTGPFTDHILVQDIEITLPQD